MATIQDIGTYTPNMRLEPARLNVMAEVGPELIERHLAFVERGISPSAGVSDKEYGLQLRAQFAQDSEGARPKHEPLRFIPIAKKALDCTGAEMSFIDLATTVRRSYDAWTPFIAREFDLDPKVVESLTAARAASYFISNLTENNVVGYGTAIQSVLRKARKRSAREILLAGNRIWLAEEDGHSEALDIYGKITDITTTIYYDAGRSSQIRTGSSEQPVTVVGLKIFTSIQEMLANRAHMNDAALFDPVGYELQMAIAADEARHGRMFKSETAKLLRLFPDDVVSALYMVIKDFEMPGYKGIPKYLSNAALISSAGLLTEADRNEVVSQCITYWGVLTPEVYGRLRTDFAKAAFESVALFVEACKQVEQKEPKVGRFALGHTLTQAQLRTARALFEKQELPKIV